ncbi:MAG: DUF481 domain-containing protein [Sedimentisphaerales bacterium]|nr:DUF481 domain-containing protein [Sedimentisphaerales bacterium]
MRYRVIAILALMTVFMETVSADLVVFKNGDSLTGKLEKLEGGKLAFDSPMLGKIEIDMEKVSYFTTEEPIEVHLTDGTIIKSKALPTGEGKLYLDATDLLKPQSLDLAAVKSINPPAKPKPKWKGNITAGFTSTNGNTFSENGSISVDATRRTEKDRTNVFGRYIVSRAEEDNNKVTTEESLSVGAQYDYFFTKKFYSFLNGRFKKDHIADLDRRIIAGLGVGYQWIESDPMNFNTDAGVAMLCEKYTTQDEITTNDEFSLQVGYHFDMKVTKTIDFIHNMIYYPSASGSISDYYLSTDAEIRASLTSNMFTSIKAILDYDSTPAEGLGNTDTKYILGLGWNF